MLRDDLHEKNLAMFLGPTKSTCAIADYQSMLGNHRRKFSISQSNPYGRIHI